ncbi:MULTISPECIES: TRAP transporter small permease [Alphaproteobacteria]|uniref:TRAP transporter small permease protein n=2 Tax=Alphaproteobacteria TaxID=28211 RepID=A0A512HJN4_9HYPH|nr:MULTISPECIES: TRAP transporter small permease [Alphaproteobacteria]GEO85667.1 hypothetical protein RNA01_25990 [Ciceribacter naphthalenivorans]GLR21978.1 hypothetical protein GCM10007920_17650 [Ciceribacter naphthalenivorans]GLT04834.1 hypothetical protein GCM10007926_17650 [Sphingomonas psychrolutea]
MSTEDTNRKGAGLNGLARKLVTGWAILGGVVLIAVVIMQSISVVTGAFGHPLPGDFELTELGIAVAMFAFLPYCQMTDANVTADIFTSGASRRVLGVLGVLASVIALAFSVIMVWRTWAGMENQFDYGYQTAILGLSIGYAFLPIIVSLILLALASIMTLIESFRQTVQPSGKVYS